MKAKRYGGKQLDDGIAPRQMRVATDAPEGSVSFGALKLLDALNEHCRNARVSHLGIEHCVI